MENLYCTKIAECRIDPYSNLITLSLKGDVDYQTYKELNLKILNAIANASPFSVSLLIDNRQMTSLSAEARTWWKNELLPTKIPEALASVSKVALVTPSQTFFLFLTHWHQKKSRNADHLTVKHFQWRHEALFWIIG